MLERLLIAALYATGRLRCNPLQERQSHPQPAGCEWLWAEL